ncbi:Triacylglycerol lipase [Mycobacterium simulans]|uniref:Triacylglycerol lipase n=1 Tax=Mycobacterium simulans TaxID=627089 RepID=A0A7Z7IFZ7_9MYCO|nr:Triacylglycerol lipase [Mycobacterium simulans]
MSFVNAYPELVAAAASDLAAIGSAISTANAAAAIPTSGVQAPGADAVSAVIAALFGAHAQAYQTLSAQAVTFHDEIVQTLNKGANSYAAAEAANASPLQSVQAVQAAQQDLLAARSGAVARAGIEPPAAPKPSAQPPAAPAASAGAAAPPATPAPPRPVAQPPRMPGGRLPGAR